MDFIRFERNEAAAREIEHHYGRAPRLFLHSYGCQQNVNDGEKIRGVLQDIGFVSCSSPEDADLVVFNTCAIREHAEDRVFGNIGALKPIKEQNPGLMIAVCGCMTQQETIVEKFRKSYPYVDIVLGTNAIDEFPQKILEKLGRKKRILTSPVERTDIVEGMPVARGCTFRAWLPIMYGCDNFCSYCIVPYVRGRERSRRNADILAEFKSLIDQGYKDITLLGQNVNSYGKGLDEGLDFSDLLAMLDKVEGDYRIRFMTSHPKDATHKLIDTIAASHHICHHLHLPVQSGSDEVLRRMNRNYTAEKYLDLIRYAKEKIPDLTFSSDIIVGFPDETEEQFEQTLDLVRTVRYAQLFTFIYSKRTGTRAAEMPDHVTHKEKTDRMARLLAVQDEITQEIYSAYAGKCVRVLVEGPGREDGVMTGRLDNNMVVEFPCTDASLIGMFELVDVLDAKGAVLKGNLV